MVAELIAKAQEWVDVLAERGGVSVEDEVESGGSTGGGPALSAQQLLALREENKERQKAGSRFDESRLVEAQTPVTRENFVEWKQRFDQELEEAALLQGGGARKGPSKLTGRQLFEAGQVETMDGEEVSGGGASSSSSTPAPSAGQESQTDP